MDEKLIELVRAYEELYDLSNKKYTDSIFKEKIWKHIGEELNKPGNECKQRWFSLRDQYRRYLKKSTKKIGQIGKYKYAEEMSFVKPFLREREPSTYHFDSEGAFVGTESAEATEEDDFTPLKKPKYDEDQLSIRERWFARESTPSQRAMKPPETASSVFMKYLMENDKEEKSVDPVDLFFQTMAATVKRFPPYYQNLCKGKVYSVVSEFEMTHILKQISPAVSASATPAFNTVGTSYPSPSTYSHQSEENTDNQLQNV